MLRVALLCEEAAGARTLQALLRGPHRLAVLLTSPRSAVWSLAERLGHRPVPAARIREPGFADELASAGTQLLLNVHSLRIVPEAVLGVPALGAYNLHPGPLPELAGLNAPSWAIYQGCAEHGVTVHRMERGIDTGPIVYRETFPIAEEDTGLSVALRCAQKGVALLVRLLEALAADPRTLPLAPQDLDRRRYFGREVPQGGRVRWEDRARRICDFVRACDYRPFASPWGVPRAELEGREVELLEVARTRERARAAPGTVRRDGGGRTLVAAADEWVWLRRMRAQN